MCVAWKGPEKGEADDTPKKALDNRLVLHLKTKNLFGTAGATVKSVLNRENIFNRPGVAGAVL